MLDALVALEEEVEPAVVAEDAANDFEEAEEEYDGESAGIEEER